jgi:hypothetical protein
LRPRRWSAVDAVLYLISAKSLTGHTLVLDGDRTL